MSRSGQRLEKTPEATFLRELDEENTNLRDALQQSVIVANSLGGEATVGPLRRCASSTTSSTIRTTDTTARKEGPNCSTFGDGEGRPAGRPTSQSSLSVHVWDCPRGLHPLPKVEVSIPFSRGSRPELDSSMDRPRLQAHARARATMDPVSQVIRRALADVTLSRGRDARCPWRR